MTGKPYPEGLAGLIRGRGPRARAEELRRRAVEAGDLAMVAKLDAAAQVLRDRGLEAFRSEDRFQPPPPLPTVQELARAIGTTAAGPAPSIPRTRGRPKGHRWTREQIIIVYWKARRENDGRHPSQQVVAEKYLGGGSTTLADCLRDYGLNWKAMPPE
jgi:hypothetical protein